jgi:peptide/nickel transport system permease protein
MTRFIARRLLISLVLMFLISVISFFIITLTPGSPYPWGELNPKISESVKANFRKQFHLDEPLWKQYWYNIRGLFNGQLRSIKDGRPVLARITESLPATLALNLTSILISLSFGLVIGVWSARTVGRWPDTSLSVVTFALLALPSFWVSYLVIIGLTDVFGIPILGTHSYSFDYPNSFSRFLDYAWHLALPAMILALAGIAAQSRYTRASMLESLGEDYIRTARAKGLDEPAVNYKHALRNSLRPLITGIGTLLPALLGGSVIIETIFAYPGIGRLGYQAVLERDYPLLVALNFIAAGLVLLGNLVADVLYAVVDPRVRLE